MRESSMRFLAFSNRHASRALVRTYIASSRRCRTRYGGAALAILRHSQTAAQLAGRSGRDFPGSLRSDFV